MRDRLRRDFDRGHVAVQARWTESLEADPSLASTSNGPGWWPIGFGKCRRRWAWVVK